MVFVSPELISTVKAAHDGLYRRNSFVENFHSGIVLFLEASINFDPSAKFVMHLDVVKLIGELVQEDFHLWHL